MASQFNPGSSKYTLIKQSNYVKMAMGLCQLIVAYS